MTDSSCPLDPGIRVSLSATSKRVCVDGLTIGRRDGASTSVSVEQNGVYVPRDYRCVATSDSFSFLDPGIHVSLFTTSKRVCDDGLIIGRRDGATTSVSVEQNGVYVISLPMICDLLYLVV